MLRITLFLTLVCSVTYVSAGVTDTLLFEVGRLWIQATRDLWSSMKNLVVYLTDTSNMYVWVCLAAVPVVCYYAYKFFWAPLNRVHGFGTLGYVPDAGRSMKETANQVRKRRQCGNPPPAYPNGWFSVMESRMLQVGEVKSVHGLGLDLAVFRGEDGVAYVIDAYCPHNGANMGIGGRVVGNCLACPFHAWQFKGTDGKCTKIPYSDGKIPDVAKVNSYNVLERNQMIFIWFHAEGGQPTWEPPEIEEITSGEWVFRGRSEHYVNAHIEEIPENGADVAHFEPVHSALVTAGTDLRYITSKLWDFGHHTFTGSWEAHSKPEGHIGSLTLKHSLSLFGFHIPVLDLKVTAMQIGPAIVHMFFDSPAGKGVYVQSLLPEEPLMQKMVHHIYMNWMAPPIVGKFFLYSEAVQVERDMMIWNNKKYEGRPVFVKSPEDQMVAKHRRWYSQFYSENSQKLTMRKDSKIEW